jgi:hypothetical protein
MVKHFIWNIESKYLTVNITWIAFTEMMTNKVWDLYFPDGVRGID